MHNIWTSSYFLISIFVCQYFAFDSKTVFINLWFDCDTFNKHSNHLVLKFDTIYDGVLFVFLFRLSLNCLNKLCDTSFVFFFQINSLQYWNWFKWYKKEWIPFEMLMVMINHYLRLFCFRGLLAFASISRLSSLKWRKKWPFTAFNLLFQYFFSFYLFLYCKIIMSCMQFTLTSDTPKIVCEWCFCSIFCFFYTLFLCDLSQCYRYCQWSILGHYLSDWLSA